MTPAQLVGLAHRLADRFVIDAIAAAGVPEALQGRRWYDTRPMLDPREHSGPAIDQAQEVLRYAHERGLISPHPEHAHLVRPTRRADEPAARPLQSPQHHPEV